MPSKILIVDDEPFNLDLLEQELSDQGFLLERASGGKEALEKLDAFQPDLMLLDFMMPDLNGVEVLGRMRKNGCEVPVIIVTAYGTVERAVQAMKAGACDFISKPFDSEHIALAVAKALEREQLKRGIEILAQDANRRYHLMLGKSRQMNRAVELAEKTAASNATVLLLGESGTGKEIFAHFIHDRSERRSRPFVVINCVGLSRDLLESDLFGHEKGAFTGAHQLKKGKVELGDGGTIFLDEIGDISLELQTKLLRFLQEREFERVGGTRPIRVDVRIVAATSRDLHRFVAEGRFREDLYYRLNVVAISLPPLRDRKEDVPVLAQAFLQRLAIETKKNFTGISDEAMNRLVSYDWPGNVRELVNVLERALVIGEGPEVGLQDLPPEVYGHKAPVLDGMSYQQAVLAYRREMVSRALSKNQGNRIAAARELGLHEKSLSRLIRSLGIKNSSVNNR
jgi:two-component system response regulator AtoC